MGDKAYFYELSDDYLLSMYNVEGVFALHHINRHVAPIIRSVYYEEIYRAHAGAYYVLANLFHNRICGGRIRPRQRAYRIYYNIGKTGMDGAIPIPGFAPDILEYHVVLPSGTPDGTEISLAGNQSHKTNPESAASHRTNVPLVNGTTGSMGARVYFPTENNTIATSYTGELYR